MRKNVLGIRLVTSIIVVKTLVLKLHIGYKRAKTKISKVIQIIKKLLFTEYKLNSNTIKIKAAKRY